MKHVYTILPFILISYSVAMDSSKIPFTRSWTKKRAYIMALLDQHSKVFLPYNDCHTPQTNKKPAIPKAKL